MCIAIVATCQTLYKTNQIFQSLRGFLNTLRTPLDTLLYMYTDFTDDDLLLVLSNSDSTNRVIRELVDVITECTER